MLCGDCIKSNTAACTGFVEAGEIPFCVGFSPMPNLDDDTKRSAWCFWCDTSVAARVGDGARAHWEHPKFCPRCGRRIF